MLTVVAPARYAGAAPDGGVTVDVQAGVRGAYQPGRSLPLHITVTSTQAVRGTLEVVDRNGGSFRSERAIELAAGTTKDIWLTFATTPFNNGAPIEVIFAGPDGVRIAKSITLDQGTDQTLVGVLPRLDEVAQPPANIAYPGDLGTAVISSVGPAQRALGLGGIDIYSIIAATSVDIVGATRAERSALLAWVGQGGTLLVDDAPGDALPPEWTPGAAGYALAGRGEVRLTNGLLAARKWATALPVGTAATQPGPLNGFFGQNFGQAPPSETLAKDAGLKLRRLGPVLVLLTVYLVLVGPILFIVLRRSRRLAFGWVAIPALAILASGLVTVVGGQSRRGASAAHVTVVETNPGGATGYTTGLVVSKGGGRAGFRLPSGWSSDLNQWGFGNSQGLVERPRPDGGDLSTVLESGQATLMSAAGPVVDSDVRGRLEVTATTNANGRASGTVRNVGGEALDDVAVFVAQGAASIGRLEPGGSQEFTIANATAIGEAAPFRVWSVDDGSVFFGNGGQFPVATVAFGPGGGVQPGDRPEPGSTQNASLIAWLNFEQRSNRTNTKYGLVQAVGWQRNTTGPIPALNGSRVRAGRTATTVVAPLAPGERLSDISIRRSVVRGGNDTTGTVRFQLPADRKVATPSLVTRPPAWVNDLEVWDGSEWLKLDTKAQPVAIPAAAVRGGDVLARFEVGFDGSGPNVDDWTMEEAS
jgi:hypothetical protein